jgi:hypothetical protein
MGTFGGIGKSLLKTPLSDAEWDGIFEIGIAGASLDFGELCYFSVADSRWELVDANAEATSFGKLGICILAAAGDGDPVKILLWGTVRKDSLFPTLTIGAPVFAGLIAGEIQIAAPSGSGDIVRIIGYGNTGNELFFCPSTDYFELM